MSTEVPALTRRELTRLVGWPRFVVLDLRSLAPFLRMILVTVAVLLAVAVIVAPNPPTLQMIVALGVVMTVPANLFAADEQAGLETLYQLLPIRKRTRVIGRYATVLLTVLIAVALGAVAALIDSTITREPLDALGAGLGVLLAASLILQAVQLPLYFALGYQRARLLNMALPFGTAAVVYLTANHVQLPADVAVSLPILLSGSVCVAVICYVISALISYRWYRRREF